MACSMLYLGCFLYTVAILFHGTLIYMTKRKMDRMINLAYQEFVSKL